MKLRKLTAAVLAALTALSFAACGNKGDTEIMVVSREEGSGTRGAFVELTGVEEKDADGNKTDRTTEEAVIQSSTDAVMTQVSGNENAIGYISMGSLNDTVKAVTVDGAEATVENVKAGKYPLSRPFNIATKGEVSEAAQDFINFIMSREGQEVVANNHYIPVKDSAEAFTSNGAEGKVRITGSSSVTPVMEKLKEAYAKVNSKVEIEVQQSDSSTGMKDAMEGNCDIGMASRELKDSEKELTATAIALDGIAVIVNKDNDVNDLSTDTVKAVYTGETTDWNDVK